MFYQIVIFVLLTVAGFLMCRQILKIPKHSMKRNIKNLQAEKENLGAKLLRKFVMPLVKTGLPVDQAGSGEGNEDGRNAKTRRT